MMCRSMIKKMVPYQSFSHKQLWRFILDGPNHSDHKPFPLGILHLFLSSQEIPGRRKGSGSRNGDAWEKMIGNTTLNLNKKYLWWRLPIFHSSTDLVSTAKSLPVSSRLIKSAPLILPTWSRTMPISLHQYKPPFPPSGSWQEEDWCGEVQTSAHPNRAHATWERLVLMWTPSMSTLWLSLSVFGKH